MWLDHFCKMKSKLLVMKDHSPYNFITACKEATFSLATKATLDHYLSYYLDTFPINYNLNKEYAAFLNQAMTILFLKVGFIKMLK